MKLIGLTGGIGMGKTAASSWLAQHGCAVADTDLIARQLVQPGQPALREIEAAFGSNLIAPDGSLRRADLAERVFNNPTDRRRLEAILHPRIRQAWQLQVHQWRLHQRPLAAIVIPLLFETGAETEFDVILCVACSTAAQQERLRSRGWTPEQISQRTRAQCPIDEKMARAHFVVWNEADLGVLGDQLTRVLRRLA